MSNAQSWAETFAPINAANRQAVFANTWGHLAPEKNVSYKGKILFCNSGYTNTSVALIDSYFENLSDSPWLYDAINDYIYEQSKELPEGAVYVIHATLRNYRFYGKPKKVYSL